MNIPDNVYYSERRDAFYDRSTCEAKGFEFWQSWISRRNEFPTKPILNEPPIRLPVMGQPCTASLSINNMFDLVTPVCLLTQDDNRSDLELDCQQLVSKAKSLGFVVTIQTVPCEPLAMGNYEMLYDVRSARK